MHVVNRFLGFCMCVAEEAERQWIHTAPYGYVYSCTKYKSLNNPTAVIKSTNMPINLCQKTVQVSESQSCLSDKSIIFWLLLLNHLELDHSFATTRINGLMQPKIFTTELLALIMCFCWNFYGFLECWFSIFE